MKVFFFMGRNRQTRSGVSWKVWKISRQGRCVTRYWGPARLDGRRVVHGSYIQSCTCKFVNEVEAAAFEQRLIASKIKKGYERKPRRR